VSAVREKLADGGLSAWLHDPDKSRGQESHVTCALCVVRAYGFMRVWRMRYVLTLFVHGA